MSFIHGLQGGKEFFSHLDLVFKGPMGVIGIVEGREGGFGRGSVAFGYFRFGLWHFFMTSAGVAISESSTPGNMVIDIG